MFIAAIALTFTSCSKDSNDSNPDVVTPDSFEFTVDGNSTVAYPGQTARLQMADQLMDAMNSSTSTNAGIKAMFDAGTGFDGNLMGTETPLDATGKDVGGKTAASSIADATVKAEYFDAMIDDFTNNVIPNWDVDAAAGVAGVHTGPSGRTVRVNAKGMELNQAFGKGLIGALCVDQIANKYLAGCYNNSSNYDNETRDPAEDNGATEKELKFDEGYGYLFGLASDYSNPTDYNDNDVLLAKYTAKVDRVTLFSFDSDRAALDEFTSLNRKSLLIFGGFGLGREKPGNGRSGWRSIWETNAMYTGAKAIPRESIERTEGCNYFHGDLYSMSLTRRPKWVRMKSSIAKHERLDAHTVIGDDSQLPRSSHSTVLVRGSYIYVFGGKQRGNVAGGDPSPLNDVAVTTPVNDVASSGLLNTHLSPLLV